MYVCIISLSCMFLYSVSTLYLAEGGILFHVVVASRTLGTTATFYQISGSSSKTGAYEHHVTVELRRQKTQIILRQGI